MTKNNFKTLDKKQSDKLVEISRVNFSDNDSLLTNKLESIMKKDQQPLNLSRFYDDRKSAATLLQFLSNSSKLLKKSQMSLIDFSRSKNNLVINDKCDCLTKPMDVKCYSLNSSHSSFSSGLNFFPKSKL